MEYITCKDNRTVVEEVEHITYKDSKREMENIPYKDSRTAVEYMKTYKDSMPGV